MPLAPYELKMPRPKPGRVSQEGLLSPSVVLLAIDRIRSTVLLPIDLPVLSRSECATIGGAIVLHFFIDRRFAAFQVCGFSRRQLAALDALRDAVLLVLLPLAHFGLRVGVLYRDIVLIAIDVAGKPVLLAVEPGTIRGRQMPVIRFPHVALFLIQPGFFGFQVLGFPGSELTALHPICDPVLLVLFSFLNDWSRSARWSSAL